jgi:TPR repeat protein
MNNVFYISAAMTVLVIVGLPGHARAGDAADQRAPVVSTLPAGSASLVQLPAYQGRRLALLGKTKKLDDKCELLLDWLGRVDEEYPQTATQRALLPERAIGVYRDDDFVQVFGRPYDQTTTEWRAEQHKKVIGKCQGLAQVGRSWSSQTLGPKRRLGMTTYASQFEPYRGLLTGGFLSEPGAFSPPAIEAAVKQARLAKLAMDRALAEAAAMPPTLAGFRDLGARLGSARSQLTVLWPSEQQHLANAISGRRSEIAGRLTDEWVREIGGFGSTLEQLRRLGSERRQRTDVVAAADGGRRAAEDVVYTAKVDAILVTLVEQRLSEASAAPGSLAGTRTLMDWRRAYDRDLQGYTDRPPVRAAELAIAANRARVIDGAFPEWQQLVNRPDASEQSLQHLSMTLGELFPGSARTDASYRTYETVLAAAVERQKQATYAAAAVQCDRYAAHSDDPEALAEGVIDGRLDATLAVGACEAAVKAANAEPRLEFQLARAYLKSDRVEDAVEHLVAAAKEGHGGALAYLGDLHIEGAPGIDADPSLAYSLYQRAVEAGFTPAEKVLADFVDMTAAVEITEAGEKDLIVSEAAAASVDGPASGVNTLTATASRRLNQPEIVNHIHSGDLDLVPKPESYVKQYLLNMADNISGVCEGQHITARQLVELRQAATLKSIEVSAAAGGMQIWSLFQMAAEAVGNPQAFVDQAMVGSVDREVLPQESMQDAFTLTARYGCGGAHLERFTRNLSAYINNEGAPKASTDAMFGTCGRDARPTGRYRGQDFCICFLGKLALPDAPVTRAERKGLSTNFWPTAQAMMARDPRRFNSCIQGIGR